MWKFRSFIGILLLVLALGIAHAQTININSADLDELTQLDGIGQARAQAIVEERDANGPFDSPEDLQNRVNGVGPTTIENNRERMSFE
jgi:competence protein ComEA